MSQYFINIGFCFGAPYLLDEFSEISGNVYLTEFELISLSDQQIISYQGKHYC